MSWRNISNFRKFSSATAKLLDFNQIPGPKYYPILGSLNTLLTLGKNEKMHLTIDKMHRKYGGMFRVKIESTDALFISSADNIRSIFAYEGKYPKHPIPPAWLYFNNKHNVQRGLLFMNDDEWLQHRQIMNIFLLKEFKWTEKLIEMTCDNFVTKIKRMVDAESATVVENLEDELYLWTIYSILNLMLGSSTSEQSDRTFDCQVWEFVLSVKKIFDTSSRLMALSPRLADKFNMKVYRDFEDAAAKSITISRNLVSILCNEMKSSPDGLLQKMKSQHLSDDVIVRIFSDLIIGAGDTTVFTMQWLLHSIARDQQLVNTLRENIQSSRNSLESPLVKCCLRETLRLYPVAPFIGRILEQDAEIGGYKIPAGVLVLASGYTSGRDAANFTNPEKFTPERWLRDENKSDETVLKPCGTLPFAMGSRSCIGKKIAMFQIHCLLTKLLQQFSLESRNKEHDVNYKLKLIGVPDKKILIAFRKILP